ncbi:hypothetical protein [Kaistella carnis]|uniref:hypothetical protein n=1 Tax=Kaistella carnis TaxID=1241979 RepID=UPI0028AC297C|nr:hypothetical protein [Kaistella carnis]
MSTIYEMAYRDSILFRIDENTRHFFSGEIIFPFTYRFDYFSEYGFTDDNVFEELQSFIKSINCTLNQIVDLTEELKEKYEKLGGANAFKKHKKTDLQEKIIRRFIENKTTKYEKKYWGKTLTTEVMNSLLNILQEDELKGIKKQESEFTGIIKNCILQYPTITFLQDEVASLTSNKLTHIFLQNTGYQDVTFKYIDSYCYLVATEFIEIVTTEEYIIEEENKLPLFVNDMQGTIPKLSEDFAKQMEGREIALLIKGGVDGRESLNLAQIKNGEFYMK